MLRLANVFLRYFLRCFCEHDVPRGYCQPNQSTWINQNYQIGTLLPLTSTMRLIVNIADPGPVFNIVEGGLDNFVITNLTGLSNTSEETFTLLAQPNPFSGSTQLFINNTNNSTSTLTIYDVLGKVVNEQIIEGVNSTLTVGQNLKSGVYTAQLKTTNGAIKTIKIVKE